MSDTIDVALLARYLDETATTDEREAVEAWLGHAADRRAALAALREAWGEDARRVDAPFDVEAAWQRLKVTSVRRRPAPARWPRVARRALAAAAILAAVAAGPVLWFVRQQPAGEPAFAARNVSEYVAGRAQRQVVHLADGSVVTLNSESRLRVAADFGERSWFARQARDVALEGEAYFEVAHDERRPFVVHTSRSTVRVLGTKFGVHAYADAPADRVALAEGAVGVAPATASPSARAGARLRPGQVVTLSAAGQIAAVRDADVSDELAWTRGWLVLENLPLEEAARRIGRWYDLDVQVADSALLNQPVTGTYRDEPIDEVLTLVASAVGARYEQRGRAVTIRPAN